MMRAVLLLSRLIVAGEVNRVLQPLGHDHLESVLAINLDLAQELNDILGSSQRQSGEDKDEGLDEGSGLSRSQSVGHGLQKLGQERTQTLLASLLHEFGSQSTNLSR
jgi:hypothetical protein